MVGVSWARLTNSGPPSPAWQAPEWPAGRHQQNQPRTQASELLVSRLFFHPAFQQANQQIRNSKPNQQIKTPNQANQPTNQKNQTNHQSKPALPYPSKSHMAGIGKIVIFKNFIFGLINCLHSIVKLSF